MKRFEPTPEQVKMYEDWIAERPEHMRTLCSQFKPWELYRMKETGNIVYVVAFDEPVEGPPTLKVNIDAAFNPGIFSERTVFGVRPADHPERTGYPQAKVPELWTRNPH